MVNSPEIFICIFNELMTKSAAFEPCIVEEMHMSDMNVVKTEQDAVAARRQFLARAGKFALVTPPAVTMLLSTSMSSASIIKSGGEDCYKPSFKSSRRQSRRSRRRR
jgi:hypothetical protein